jgi:PAS domain S-box-containing protein
MHQLQDNISDYILNNCNEGIFMFDSRLRCSFWNSAMESMTGYSQEECVGKEVFKTFPFLEKIGIEVIFQKILKGENIKLQNQGYYIPEKGKGGYYNAKFLPQYDAAGQITGGLAYLQDCSVHNSTIQVPENSGQRYIQLLEEAPLAISVITADEILYANDTTLALLGAQQKQEVEGKSPFQFVANSSRQLAEEDIMNIFSNKILTPVELLLKRLDGTEFFAEISYLSIHYLGKQAIQLIKRDLTKEKNTHRELLSHKCMFNEAQNLAGLGSYQVVFNKENQLQSNLIWTDGLYDILEIDKNTAPLVLETYFNLVEDQVKIELSAIIQQLQEGKIEKAYHSHRVKLASGRQKYIKLIGKPVFNDSGEMTDILGSLQDVSEQKKTEEELFHANHLLNLHFENSPIGIIQLNNKMEVKSWSRHAERIFGWESTEVIGKNLKTWSFIHEDHQKEMLSISEKLHNASLNCKKGLVKLYTKKNTIVYCEYFLSCVNEMNGSLNSIFVLVNDITMRKLAEQARSEGQLEERKRIARDIHDGIGQMLIASKYKLASLESMVAEEDMPHFQSLEKMLEQTLEEVRSVSRNLAPRSVATMGLESSLRQMCDQIRKLTALDLKFRYIGGEHIISNKTVHALYRIAQEAIQNVVKHAQATNASIQVFQGRNFIELKIEDNGKGIEGTVTEGQGLKNMEERVNLLNGRFQVYSEKGNGTTIIINIPQGVNEEENEL